MKTLRVWWSKAAGFLKRKNDEEFDEEIEAHLDLLKQRFIAQGMTPKEAAKAARKQFGSVTVLKETQREQGSFLSPVEWWRDVRFGLRMLKKRPASNAAVVVALALGIGMNAAVFSFVNALLLRPAPGVVAISSLNEVWLHNRSGSGIESFLPFDYPDYVYFRDHSRSLEGLLAFDGDGHEAIWNRAGEGEVVQGQLVSGNYFSLAGVGAMLGRMISPDDDQLSTPRYVAVLNHSFWQKSLGSDPAIVGKALVFNGTAFTVVGVAPAGFSGLMVGTTPDFWAPLATGSRFIHDADRMTNWNGYWLVVAGRMKPGIGRAQVQAEMHFLADQARQLHRDSESPLDALIYPTNLVPGPYRGYVAAFTGLLLTVFLLVLLIACTNAASLLLARSVGRAREMAIRSALGASRGRILRQLLIESLILSSIAGAAGVAIAWAGARLLLMLKPSNIPVTLEVPIDWRVLLFTLAVSVGTGLVFGIVPAVRSAAVDAAPVLKEEGQSAGLRKSRLRSALLIGEIATCVVLLSAAALCVRSLMHANSINPGFETHGIAVATLDPSSLGYSNAKTGEFYRRFMERVLALPGVTAASYIDHLPLGTARSQTSAGHWLGKDPDQIRVDVFRVDPDYFRTMGIELLSGRDFTQKETDTEAAGVVVVNEFLAERLWPGENAIGKRLALGGEETMSEVIGVVRGGKYRTLGESPIAVVYRGELPPRRTVVIHTPGDARGLLEAVRRQVQAVDPLMAATDLQTIEEYMALPLFPARTTGLLLGFSGILALVLTTVGLFGVIAYVVSQRTHEIGVRMALGARRSDVLKLVMRQGLHLTLTGLGIGLCAAFFAARLLSPLLYGIGANDPTTLLAVALGLTGVAMLACYLPARRAMEVDPATALRYE
jgi:macrolide transport system ATP-binding/permease protein